MGIRTPLAIVKHLGSAKSGTSDHIKQRISAILMIPLLMWFVITAILFLQTPMTEMPFIFASPWNLLPMLFLIGASMYHAFFGLKMVIEDYITCKCFKKALLIIITFFCMASFIAGAVGVSTIHSLSNVQVQLFQQ